MPMSCKGMSCQDEKGKEVTKEACGFAGQPLFSEGGKHANYAFRPRCLFVFMPVRRPEPRTVRDVFRAVGKPKAFPSELL